MSRCHSSIAIAALAVTVEGGIDYRPSSGGGGKQMMLIVARFVRVGRGTRPRESFLAKKEGGIARASPRSAQRRPDPFCLPIAIPRTGLWGNLSGSGGQNQIGVRKRRIR